MNNDWHKNVPSLSHTSNISLTTFIHYVEHCNYFALILSTRWLHMRHISMSYDIAYMVLCVVVFAKCSKPEFLVN